MKPARALSLLLLLMLAACAQPAALGVRADRSSSDRPFADLPVDEMPPPGQYSPAAQAEIDPYATVLPTKIGDCAETTVTMVTDRSAGKPGSRARQGSDGGSLIRFSNSGTQVSPEKERAVLNSKVFDKVSMCLVEIPKDCQPDDTRPRVYKTTNLRTKEIWTLPDNAHGCDGA